ncbi:MAG: hypothetical protein ACQEP8_06020 [Chlamydiota bacterium]
MKIWRNLTEVKSKPAKTALTIGNFDGVHAGHQALIDSMPDEAYKVALTFSSLPSKILKPKENIEQITALPQRLELLENCGIDAIILLDFTANLSFLSPKEFLSQIFNRLPFQHLILGHDAHLGHRRQGSPAIIRNIGNEVGFEVKYLPPYKIHNQVVSSSLIRSKIIEGQLGEAEELLQHPYTIKIPPNSIPPEGTSFLEVKLQDLALPPQGSYSTQALVEGQRIHGSAQISHTPPLLTAYFPYQIFSAELNVEVKSPSRPAESLELAATTN